MALFHGVLRGKQNPVHRNLEALMEGQPLIPLATHKYKEVACPICHFMQDLRYSMHRSTLIALQLADVLVSLIACDLISNLKVEKVERSIMEATRRQEAFRDMGRRPIKGMEESTSEEPEWKHGSL